MREPKAINDLALESENLKNQTRDSLPRELPIEIESLFGDWSNHFSDQVIFKWREDKRFDELIDYLLYQYQSFDGHAPWEQILLDLNMEKDKKRAIRLLEGLLKEREKILRSTLKKYKEDPENLGLQVALTIHKASVLKLLAEMEYSLCLKSQDDIDSELLNKLRKRIKKVQNYGQPT